MRFQLISLGLAITYLLYYVINKLLLTKYTFKEILVNAYLVSAVIVFIIYRKDLDNSIIKFDYKYLLIIFLSIIMLSSSALAIFACNNNINFGIISSLANAIYLPLVTFIAFYFFKLNVNYINMLGIILIGIGSYLINI